MKDIKRWLGNRINLKSFVIGMIIGIICGFLLFSITGNRYEVIARGEGRSLTFLKINKMTGKTWLLSEDTWIKIDTQKKQKKTGQERMLDKILSGEYDEKGN